MNVVVYAAQTVPRTYVSLLETYIVTLPKKYYVTDCPLPRTVVLYRVLNFLDCYKFFSSFWGIRSTNFYLTDPVTEY